MGGARASSRELAAVKAGGTGRGRLRRGPLPPALDGAPALALAPQPSTMRSPATRARPRLDGITAPRTQSEVAPATGR